MERWTTTIDSREAAALARLGCTVKVFSQVHEVAGKRVVRFQVSTMTEDGEKVGKLRKDLKEGVLPVLHPMYVMWLAFTCRKRVLDLQEAGVFCRLLPVRGAEGRLWCYGPATEGLRGVKGAAGVVRTKDVDVVAALGVVGCELLEIRGPAGNREYAVEAFGGMKGMDVARELELWRKRPEEMVAGHPLTIALRVLRDLQQIKRMARESIDTVVLSKHRTTRHAVVRSDAAPEAWDEVKRFFGG
jgi:hypothetical protein